MKLFRRPNADLDEIQEVKNIVGEDINKQEINDQVEDKKIIGADDEVIQETKFGEGMSKTEEKGPAEHEVGAEGGLNVKSEGIFDSYDPEVEEDVENSYDPEEDTLAEEDAKNENIDKPNSEAAFASEDEDVTPHEKSQEGLSQDLAKTPNLRVATVDDKKNLDMETDVEEENTTVKDEVDIQADSSKDETNADLSSETDNDKLSDDIANHDSLELEKSNIKETGDLDEKEALLVAQKHE